MKKLLLLSTFLIASSNFPLVAAELSGPCNKTGYPSCDQLFVSKGKDGQCSNGAACAGIEADLTCKNNSTCINFGKRKPKCDKTSTCKNFPLESLECRWNPRTTPDRKFTCDIKALLPSPPFK
jgi:hypothetical protein